MSCWLTILFFVILLAKKRDSHISSRNWQEWCKVRLL